ncbi:hypothetical protein GCM10011408_01530 [Dyella caseinilytica]|nr:hypothetical protein GCM10011408_01530 [Dyella caseinilytica]
MVLARMRAGWLTNFSLGTAMSFSTVCPWLKLVIDHRFDKTNVSILDIGIVNTYAKVLKDLS